MDARKKRGIEAEQAACKHLEQAGLKCIARNYHCRRGEIDLIMLDHKQLVFVEVRYRSNPHFGSGAESVTYNKQQKLIATASHYLQQQPHNGVSRFDVVSLSPHQNGFEINWIQDAFQA